MKKKIFILIVGCAIVLTPALSFSVAYAANPIVPDCNTGALINGKPLYDQNGKPLLDSKNQPVYEQVYKNPCNFDSLMTLINNVINFLLITIVTPLVALILVYAGFLMIFSGGSSEKVTKAKSIIKNVVIGFVIALAAWLVVKTILVTLGFTGPMFLAS
ncbi:MAG TPA: pilin [Candidatus Paceibacterota bacterium]|nr:pilin [Candidatus Paceibacterota bacterium]